MSSRSKWAWLQPKQGQTKQRQSARGPRLSRWNRTRQKKSGYGRLGVRTDPRAENHAALAEGSRGRRVVPGCDALGGELAPDGPQPLGALRVVLPVGRRVRAHPVVVEQPHPGRRRDRTRRRRHPVPATPSRGRRGDRRGKGRDGSEVGVERRRGRRLGGTSGVWASASRGGLLLSLVEPTGVRGPPGSGSSGFSCLIWARLRIPVAAKDLIEPTARDRASSTKMYSLPSKSSTRDLLKFRYI
jgi:hypothetical protein